MTIRRFCIAALLALAVPAASVAQPKLNDLEMAHVAVTASQIDIAYAHLALALSNNPAIRDFADTMIRDHSAVNGQVAALAKRLGVMAEDNAMSRQLLADAARIKDEMSRLRGSAFDAYYAANELKYHQSVNGAVEDTFIPNLKNAEVKKAFEGALAVFRGHERHAEQLAGSLSRVR